jgi:ABC-type phosphate transport system permease subunit
MKEMAEKKKNSEPDESETGTGEESNAEKAVSRFMAVVIHLFLVVIAVLLLVAAIIGAYDTVVGDFPALWHRQQDEYGVLQRIVETLLLIAIAAEFALLLLFRRLSAAVEVVVFVLARKTVNPDITALDLMMCAAAIAGLIVLRFYYLPGKTT